MKCKEKREISNPEEVVMNKKGGKKGRALKGTCPVCSTKMFRILPSKATPEAPTGAATEVPEIPEAPTEEGDSLEDEASSFEGGV